jgi:hypothetical protein
LKDPDSILLSQRFQKFLLSPEEETKIPTRVLEFLRSPDDLLFAARAFHQGSPLGNFTETKYDRIACLSAGPRSSKSTTFKARLIHTPPFPGRRWEKLTPSLVRDVISEFKRSGFTGADLLHKIKVGWVGVGLENPDDIAHAGLLIEAYDFLQTVLEIPADGPLDCYRLPPRKPSSLSFCDRSRMDRGRKTVTF